MSGRLVHRALSSLRRLVPRLRRAHWACLVVLVSLLWAGQARAVPLLASEYVDWPPGIRLKAPVDGWYMLISHGPEGDSLYMAWPHTEGEVITFPFPTGEWAADSYHIQVGENPLASHVLLETVRYAPAPHVLFFGWVSNQGGNQ